MIEEYNRNKVVCSKDVWPGKLHKCAAYIPVILSSDELKYKKKWWIMCAFYV